MYVIVHNKGLISFFEHSISPPALFDQNFCPIEKKVVHRCDRQTILKYHLPPGSTPNIYCSFSMIFMLTNRQRIGHSYGKAFIDPLVSGAKRYKFHPIHFSPCDMQKNPFFPCGWGSAQKSLYLSVCLWLVCPQSFEQL